MARATPTYRINAIVIKNFTVYAAPLEDVNQGWIRIADSELPHRSIVKLMSNKAIKPVYCEVLTIDKNFLRAYNKSPRKSISEVDTPTALVASHWYRTRLGGLNTQNKYEIIVTPANGYYGRVRACLDHPQVAIRIATQLGLLGLILGIVGIMPVIFEIIKWGLSLFVCR